MVDKIKVSVVGAAGKMGSQIISQVLRSDLFELVGALESAKSDLLGADISKVIGGDPLGIIITADSLDCVLRSDAIIDFSSPISTISVCELAAQARKVHVIGTTGFTPEQEEQILAAARHATIIKSGNMSLGVNALLGTVEKISSSLDSSWDIEISDHIIGIKLIHLLVQLLIWQKPQQVGEALMWILLKILQEMELTLKEKKVI